MKVCMRRMYLCPGLLSLGQSRYSPQQQQSVGARTYTLRPISSSVPNPSGGPRTHDYAIRASGAQAVQVAPRLLGLKTPLTTTHEIIGEPGGWFWFCVMVVGISICAAHGVTLSIWGFVVPPLG